MEEEGTAAVARRNRGGADGVNLWILFAGAEEETSAASAEVAISSLKIDIQLIIDYLVLDGKTIRYGMCMTETVARSHFYLKSINT